MGVVVPSRPSLAGETYKGETISVLTALPLSYYTCAGRNGKEEPTPFQPPTDRRTRRRSRDGVLPADQTNRGRCSEKSMVSRRCPN